jgi:hypothetical protein
MQQERDEQLWRIAQMRAQFRRNLYAYIVINSFLWLVWWFTSGRYTGLQGYPWPIWVMLGWGIGLAMQYFRAYNGSKQDLAEEEYEKLKRRKQSSNL